MNMITNEMIILETHDKQKISMISYLKQINEGYEINVIQCEIS